MAISSASPFAEATTITASTKDNITTAKMEKSFSHVDTVDETPPRRSINTSVGGSSDGGSGSMATKHNMTVNDNIPTLAELKKIDEMSLLDRDGRLIPFKDIYTGPNVARRVLIIFVRHFFCGNCQEYLRTLSESVSTSSLLHLPIPTFIAVIGPGDPSHIASYAQTTNCPFPIYADPTRHLYDAFGMGRTLDLGERPDYQRRSTVKGMIQSIGQGLRALKDGNALKAGDMSQVGGEFLFEPLNPATPIASPLDGQGGQEKQLGFQGMLGGKGEEKRVTWCHRMRNTRDHVEIPELREVLGFLDEGIPGKDPVSWEKARMQRKGTGLSSTSVESAEPALQLNGGTSSVDSSAPVTATPTVTAKGPTSVNNEQPTNGTDIKQ